ncbi:MAG: prolyl oligopeptidase family serine peptidase, partial [Firmicutes bacterium]|nr:prolyl oligopeptidase family serine peptidase [Bacillota bacterium]
MAKQAFGREDLMRFSWAGAPALAPEGGFAAFAVKTVAADHKGYRTEIHVLDTASGDVRTFTHGRHKDALLTVTRRDVVLISDRAVDRQVFFLPRDGGEARQITYVSGSVAHAVPSPDGRRLALLINLKDGENPTYTKDAPPHLCASAADDGKGLESAGAPEAAEKAVAVRAEAGDDKEAGKDKLPEPYEVKRIAYKSDGSGLWKGKYAQLAVCDVADGRVRVLTEGPWSARMPAWSPDGRAIAYVQKRSDDEFVNFSDIYVVDVETGESRSLTHSTHTLGMPVFSPDGQTIACFGHDSTYESAAQTTIYTIPAGGLAPGDAPRCIVGDGFPYDVSPVGMSDMRSHEGHPGPLFSSDGRSVLALFSARGNVSLGRFDLDGGVHPIVTGSREVYSFDYCAATGEIVFCATDVSNPGEVYACAADGSDEKRLTDLNPWLAEREIATVEELCARREDGTELQAWLMRPTAGGDGPWPVIHEVHGGPHAMYSHSFFLEFQLFAAAGYAVVYGNPRGSGGYGQAFVDACRGDYGGEDYRDLLAILDAALASDSRLDGARVGVTGGSYGGFMTNWIVGHTDRYKAAITLRSISNWISFNGVSDIGYMFTERE